MMVASTLKINSAKLLKVILVILAVEIVALIVFGYQFENKKMLNATVVYSFSAFALLYALRAMVTGGYTIRGYTTRRDEHPKAFYFCVTLTSFLSFLLFMVQRYK
jgi:hypothetical protein